MIVSRGAVVAMKRDDLGQRRHHRVEIETPAILYLKPNGRGMHCLVQNISDGGVSLQVGDLPVPNIFILQLTPQIRRLCKIAWRQNDILGASFVTPKEVRKAAEDENRFV